MEEVEVMIINISDYTCWYKNQLNKSFLMFEREDCYFKIIKGKEFTIKKKDSQKVIRTE